jgi:hypothetical protein
LVSQHSSSAKCADCVANCGKYVDPNDPYCAFYKAETCRNALFIGCVCNYNGDEGQRPKYGSGIYSKCP